jgi:hypothetical protein
LHTHIQEANACLIISIKLCQGDGEHFLRSHSLTLCAQKNSFGGAERRTSIEILYAVTISCTMHISVWSRQSGRSTLLGKCWENRTITSVCSGVLPCNHGQECISEEASIYLLKVSAERHIAITLMPKSVCSLRLLENSTQRTRNKRGDFSHSYGKARETIGCLLIALRRQ